MRRRFFSTLLALALEFAQENASGLPREGISGEIVVADSGKDHQSRARSDRS